MKWACGVTTVPERATTTLPRTLTSLAAAGFDSPRLFADGPWYSHMYGTLVSGTSFRGTGVGAYGNWTLGLTELFLREPKADRYAMFEDDVLLCRNVRQHLERCEYPKAGYWNLYTVPDNIDPTRDGWQPSAQRGRGALALVFDGEAVKFLLCSMRAVNHAESSRRGYYLTDGAVLESMRKVGHKEWVHWPSLVQHVGAETTIRDRLAPTRAEHMTAPSFPGEDKDAMEFLR
jgi:hypothetical protein